MPKIWTILSVDGGGIRGTIPAQILARLEEKTDCRIVDLFDFIAGTSTGGILAAGLTLPDANGQPKYTAQQMVGLYEQEGPVIFKTSRLHIIKQWILGGGKYPSQGIDSVLAKYFGEARFSNQLNKVMIPAVETTTRQPWFFKNWDADDGQMLTRDIARATSAAPMYFDPVPFKNDGCLIDGGLNANSPAVCALAEAIRLSGPGDQFVVVSIGTGRLVTPYSYKKLKGLRPFQWLEPALDLLYDGMPQIADYELDKVLLKQMLPPHLQHHASQIKAYYRFQISLDESTQAMDNAAPDNIAKLKALGDKVVDESQAADFEAMASELCAVKEDAEDGPSTVNPES